MNRGALKRTVETVAWYTQSAIASARLPGRNSAYIRHIKPICPGRRAAEGPLTRETKAQERHDTCARYERGVELRGERGP